ncbi:hypothetical protein QBC43DRAFT_312722 [Cladorrhinum sp. PSN259]|nr:hypothetical protein QBC43DRAFT_312722 [Cladorrhinum sp. PSN259]
MTTSNRNTPSQHEINHFTWNFTSTHYLMLIIMANNSNNSLVSRKSQHFRALVNYVDKNSPTEYFLFTISVFREYAKGFLAALHQRGERICRPEQNEIERHLNLPAHHPQNAWIYAPSKAWSQTEHATAYFMRMIKGELDGEKTWAGQSDIWPRWGRFFWSGFARLQDVYMEEWIWPTHGPEAKRVFTNEEVTERKMRAVLLGLFEQIERDGPYVLGED